MRREPTKFILHEWDRRYYRNESFCFLNDIISRTRQSLIDPNWSAMRRPYFCVLLNRPVTTADIYTDAEDKHILAYFSEHFPEIRLQRHPYERHATSRSGTIFLNYDLVRVVDTASYHPTINHNVANTFTLLLTVLYHEYAHTLGIYTYFNPMTPDTLGERGWAVEDHMFGGKLRLLLHPGCVGFERIDGLMLERNGEPIIIRKLLQMIMIVDCI